MLQENSERIGMKCEEMTLDGTIEPLHGHSFSKNDGDYNKFATKMDITDDAIITLSIKLERKTVLGA